MIWHSSYNSRIAQIIDVCTALISFIATYYLSILLHNIDPSNFPAKTEFTDSHYALIIILSFIYKILYDRQNAYSYQRFTSLIREYSIVVNVSFLGFLITIAFAYLFGFRDISRTFYIVFFIINLIFFLSEKTLLFYAASYIRRKGKNRKRIVLIGSGIRASNFRALLKTIFLINRTLKNAD